MARRNSDLLSRLPAPLEVLPVSECGACGAAGLVVAAKWLAAPDELCITEMNAEYLCSECHIVFENNYDGPGTGNNLYSSRPDDLLKA